MKNTLPLSNHTLPKLSIAAAVVLLSTQGIAADWAVKSTNIENSGTDVNYYVGEHSSVDIGAEIIQQQDQTSNFVGKLNDSNTDELNGFSLNVNNVELNKKALLISAASRQGIISNNQLNIINLTQGHDVEARAGHSYQGEAIENTLVIDQSTIDKALGGYSRNGRADNNKIIVKGNADVRVLHGGRTWFSKQGAKNNQVEVSGSIVSWVYGGESQGGEVSGNKVLVKAEGQQKSTSRAIIGGKSATSTKTNVNNNQVIIINSDIQSSLESDAGVYGGIAAYGNADSNQVSIQSQDNLQSIIDGNVFGAYNEGRNTYGATTPSTANENSVSISNSQINGDVYGAKSAGSNTDRNIINLQHSQANNVYGGYTVSGSASHNHLILNQSEISGNLYGGYISDGLDKEASHNQLDITDSQIKGSIYGGYNSGTERNTINNVVNLQGKISVSGDIIGGLAEAPRFGDDNGDSGFSDFGGLGWLGSSGSFSGFGSFRSLSAFPNFNNFGNDSSETINADVTTGNTLTLQDANVSAKSVKNFAHYIFITPQNISANTSMLTLTGSDDVDLTSSDITVSIGDNPRLKLNENFNLIQTENAKLNMKTVNQSVRANGLFQDNLFQVQNTPTALQARLHQKILNDNGKTALDVNALYVDSLDKLWASANDVSQTLMADHDKEDVVPFANISGGKINYTNRTTEARGLVSTVGFAIQSKQNHAGIFFEHQQLSYHARNQQSTFDGKIYHYGIGFLAQIRFTEHLYGKSIVRAGRMHSQNHNNVINYRLSVPYYSASLSLGQQAAWKNLAADSQLSYVYSYLGSQQSQINNETVRFNHHHSSRVKFQSQWRYNHPLIQPFVTFKFDYKLNDTNQIATLADDEILARQEKGGNVGGELGLRLTPSPQSALSLSVGKMFGKQRQNSAKIQFMYRF